MNNLVIAVGVILVPCVLISLIINKIGSFKFFVILFGLVFLLTLTGMIDVYKNQTFNTIEGILKMFGAVGAVVVTAAVVGLFVSKHEEKPQ